MHYCGDYSRATDFLTARPEVDKDRLGFVGISWGAITGITYVAYDPRIKAMGSMVGGGNFLGAFSAKEAIGFAVQSAQIRPREQGLLPSRCVAADEADALGDVGDGIFPLVFVFDGDVAFEVLALQFIQNCRNVRHAGAVWQVVRLDLAELVQVFQVTADDTAF